MMQQEDLFFMDIFGKPFHVYLSISAGPTRAAKIASTLAAMNNNEAALTAYALANGHDLTDDLASGTASIAAATLAATKTAS